MIDTVLVGEEYTGMAGRSTHLSVQDAVLGVALYDRRDLCC